MLIPISLKYTYITIVRIHKFMQTFNEFHLLFCVNNRMYVIVFIRFQFVLHFSKDFHLLINHFKLEFDWLFIFLLPSKRVKQLLYRYINLIFFSLHTDIIYLL